MPTGRYVIYGVIPSEHEDDNSDTPSAQKIGGTVPIYDTEDREEARSVMNAGGFFRKEQWYAAIWAKDTVDGGTIGEVPADV